MGLIEDGIERNFEKKRIIDEARDNPEKMGEILRSYIDKYVENGDTVGLNMLVDFILGNLEAIEHSTNYSKRNIELRKALEKPQGEDVAD